MGLLARRNLRIRNPLNQELDDECPQAKFSPQSVFVNKVLLEHSNAHLCASFPLQCQSQGLATETMPAKPKISTIWPGRKFANPRSRQKAPQGQGLRLRLKVGWEGERARSPGRLRSKPCAFAQVEALLLNAFSLPPPQQLSCSRLSSRGAAQ